MHLTLRFFGDTTKEEITQIIQAMKDTAAAVNPFSISVHGIGVFPGIKHAKVIWAGVNGQREQLLAVKRILEQNLSNTGIAPDKKRFSPHFTLGRFKQSPDSKVLTTIIQIFETDASDPYLIKSMVLYKSDLKSTGAVHTPLFEVVLSRE